MTLAVLKKAIQSYGQQKALAHDIGIAPSLVSEAYCGKKLAPPKMLKALGLERTIKVTRTVTYQWKEDGE